MKKRKQCMNKISDIVYKYLRKAYEMGLKRDKFSGQQSESDLPALSLNYMPQIEKEIAEAIAAWNQRPDDQWDLKEWPVQTHLRSKTMDEHVEKIKCLFGDELSPWIKVEDLPSFMTESAYPPSDEQWLTKYFVLEYEAMPTDVVILTAAEIWLKEDSEAEYYMPIPQLPED